MSWSREGWKFIGYVEVYAIVWSHFADVKLLDSIKIDFSRNSDMMNFQ